MTKYHVGDRIRVTFPTGTVVEGKVKKAPRSGIIDIQELANFIDPERSDLKIELLERATPPQGTCIRATSENGMVVYVGIIDQGRFMGYYSHPDGAAITVQYVLSELKSWEVIA